MNTNTTSNDFIGKRIAISREQMKISRFELADKMCLSRSIVGKWERGISNPSIAHLVKLASVLGVSFEWLATGLKMMINLTYKQITSANKNNTNNTK
jgi:transcriptional regulator with XRE-family HTH domain